MKKIFLLSLLLATFSFAQKPIFTAAKVKAVTVYFNAAEISQATSVNLPVGTSEIVIKNVANYLNENTVQIGAPSSVTVLSVQFTNNYISEFEIDETNPTIKKVRDSITLVQKEIKKVQILTYSHQQTIALLDANHSAGGANAGINVAELMKLVEYYKAKRTELDNEIVAHQEKEANLNKKLITLNNKLEINTQKEEKSSTGKLVIQVMNDVAGTIPLDISYITETASWNPFYDLRTENTTSPINMMYKAQVFQSSGIDWKKVKLTLSSGNPNQNNTAPILSSWFLRYGDTTEGYYRNGDSNIFRSNVYSRNSIQSLPNISNRVDSNGYIVTGEDLSKQFDTLPNGKIMARRNFDNIGNFTSINENQLNVTFDIDIPYDILSNGKAHSVALKEIKLPATYKYYAVPRVDKEAY